MPLLEVKGLVKYYGRRKVVDGVDFGVDAGEVVGLLGPNGAGKTTSFRMATGQISPNAGRVIFNGRDVTGLPMYKRARLGMGYLSQETSVFRRLTVEDAAAAHVVALDRAPEIGFDTFIISALTPFSPEDCEQLMEYAPVVVHRYFPRYREIYADVAELLQPGVRYEDFVREGLRRGALMRTDGNLEQWLADRMRRFRHPGAPTERQMFCH